MLKGSVRAPQCAGAYSSDPAAVNTATHTCTHIHQTPGSFQACICYTCSCFLFFVRVSLNRLFTVKLVIIGKFKKKNVQLVSSMNGVYICGCCNLLQPYQERYYR